jgi:hypothetical protein
VTFGFAGASMATVSIDLITLSSIRSGLRPRIRRFHQSHQVWCDNLRTAESVDGLSICAIAPAPFLNLNRSSSTWVAAMVIISAVGLEPDY